MAFGCAGKRVVDTGIGVVMRLPPAGLAFPLECYSHVKIVTISKVSALFPSLAGRTP